ncbi:MAG TPA: hypothetical protein VGO04_16730 [Ensifer sp.]|jgi:hypothetical protein|uniref:hypothetical protein n=1 Tax=Ensifer sp. TaxID=1872086 RepID=UPI002E0D7DA2|nr:hypothetical protein [Ensifer sp.]
MVIKRFFPAAGLSTLNRSVPLPPIRWAAVVFCGLGALAAGSAGSQEAPDWDEMSSGAADVRGVGAVHFSVGYSSAGYDHFRSQIVVRWRDGADRTQVIYDGIYDKPPAKVWGVQGHVCVSMEACARYEDVCTTQMLAYRYDAAAKAFNELADGEGSCRR